MLSATRRRVVPASLLASAALTAGLLATVPAQATTVPTSTAVAAPTAVTAARTATTTTVRTASTVTLTAAQITARRIAVKRATAVKVAKSRVHISRYVAGAAGPRRFDCSGLALWVAKRAYGKSLPHSSRAQFRALKHVAKKNLRPGDLVFFFKRGAHHVGIYIGHGRMVSATNPRTGIKIDAVFSGWYGSRYSGAARVV